MRRALTSSARKWSACLDDVGNDRWMSATARALGIGYRCDPTRFRGPALLHLCPKGWPRAWLK